MIVARDYVAKIRVFHTLDDSLNGRFDKAEDYFKRHGWDRFGSGEGVFRYKGMKYAGYRSYPYR